MPDINLIAKALDFVEDNLQIEITVADMANAVSYSLYHFCRSFNQATHHTPYDYLMRRRLSEAARALLQTEGKIIDIALDYQFNSPETFSRAFKRLFEMQPSQVRRQGSIDSRRLMPRLTLPHIQQINKGVYLEPVLAELDAFQVAGVMTIVRDDPGIISELWELLAHELGGEEHTPRPASYYYYGITFFPQGWENRWFLYMAAVEILGLDMPNAALVTKSIPALKCARFIHKGPRKDLPLTLDYVYHTWLPKSGNSLSHRWVIEQFDGDARGADHEESETAVYMPIT